MQERKMLLLHLPAEMVDNLRKIKGLRSKQRGKRVTWAELFDEATENYIREAEKVLDEMGVKVRDDHGK